MSYDYNVYYRQDCIVPLALALVSALFLLKIVIFLIKKDKDLGLRERIKHNIPQLCGIALSLLLLVVNVIHLSRGGVKLLFEKEDQAIQITGIVEKTLDIDAITGSKYEVEQNNGRGQAIVIEDEKYYMTAYGDIDVGDRVEIVVLPKSKYVLQIQKIQ